jgi:hypothetical protein
LPKLNQPQGVRGSQDIVIIEVSIPAHAGFDKKTEIVKIHKTREMKDLYSRVRTIIKEGGRWTNDLKDVKILYKNSIVNEDISL